MKRFRIYDLDIEVPAHLLTPGIERGLEKGWYERDEVEIARSRLGVGDRVIELGAGLGVTALVAARLVGPENIRAFEANPALLDVEQNNAAVNGLDVIFQHKVLLPEALMPACRSIQFAVANEFWASALAGSENAIDVPAASLEDAIADLDANALVMDIEGFEVELIENADLSTINKFIFEIHYDQRGKKRTNSAVDKLIRSGCEIDYSLCSRSVLYLERQGI